MMMTKQSVRFALRQSATMFHIAHYNENLYLKMCRHRKMGKETRGNVAYGIEQFDRIYSDK